KTGSRVTLIYSNPSEHQTIFYQELTELQKKYDARFQLKFLFSNSNDILSKRLSRWLLDQLIPKYLGGSAGDTEYYLCGPFEYMQMAEITLRMYAPGENIHKENFSTLPRLRNPEPPDKEKHKVTIELGEHSYDLDVQYPNTVLSAAKREGVELPYSCEAGRCGSCIASCSSGKMWMAYNEVLTDKEVEAGRVLVCQAYPVGGDATIVYDNVF
ncbi:MAG: 2Fe-2S iron-sulfur cluster binding domain-containing protein, partial [Bacteroidia bacterium]|nr:2Fe-2S iron-sulfur cluster binding domain-containing protein [Bacteroidia bacterium]